MYKKDIIRNYKGIQFEKLRRKVDPKFNDVHDEISDCFYNKKPFRNYGLLNKERFDKIHGLIFFMKDVIFHQENLKQETKDIIPENQYNNITDKDNKIIDKKSDQAVKRIAEFKKDNIELTI